MEGVSVPVGGGTGEMGERECHVLGGAGVGNAVRDEAKEFCCWG